MIEAAKISDTYPGGENPEEDHAVYQQKGNAPAQ